MTITILLIISAAVAAGGFSAIQLGKSFGAYAARKAEDLASCEEIKREQQKLDNEVHMKELELAKERESEEKAEAARLLREEDERIRNNRERYPVEQMILTYTSASYAQAGRVAARAGEAYEASSTKIADEERCMGIGAGLANSLFMIWLVTVAANIIMTGLMLWSIMGLVAILAAPALVLAPTAIMYWIRNSVDRHKRGQIPAENMYRTITAGAAGLVLVGGLLLGNADARASYVYDSRINIAQLRLDQLNDPLYAELNGDDPSYATEVKLQEALLADLVNGRERAAQTFTGLLAIALPLECLGAYFFTEFIVRRRIRMLEQDRDDARLTRDSAEDAQQEIAMATRNSVIERMIGLGLYDDGVLHWLGLDEPGQDGDEDDDVFMDDEDAATEPEVATTVESAEPAGAAGAMDEAPEPAAEADGTDNRLTDFIVD